MNYAIPTWLTVKHERDAIDVFDEIRGSHYRLRGHLAETLDRIACSFHCNESATRRVVAAPSGPCYSPRDLRILVEKGIVVDAGDVNSPPLFIPTQQPLLRANPLGASATGGVCFFGAPSNVGNRSTIGTADSPDALRRLSGAMHLDRSLMTLRAVCESTGVILDGFTCESCVRADNAFAQLYDAGNIVAFLASAPSMVHRRVRDAVSSLLRSHLVPFMLGGDHALTAGALEACGECVSSFDVVHLDAHTDCYRNAFNSLEDFTGYPNHGTVMSWSLQRIKSIRRMNQFGVRGVGNSYQFTDGRRNADRRRNIIPLADVLSILEGTVQVPDADPKVPVYLTIDMDVLDPSVAPGTATPVPNGLGLKDLLLLLARLLSMRELLGVDVVELDVSRDRDCVTQSVALEIISFIMGLVASGYVRLCVDPVVRDHFNTKH